MSDTPSKPAYAYCASAYEVHVARLWGELWGPVCDSEPAWSVPLIHPEFWKYATCVVCRRQAIRR